MANYFDCAALMGQLTSAEMQRKLKQASGAEAYNEFLLLVNGAPVADVAPVVNGKWIRPHWKNSNYCCDCSECGGEAMHRDYQWDKNGIYPICPNCGARMDGDDDAKEN